MDGLEERDSQTPDWLETTWNKYAPKIYKLCCKKCKNVEDAKELFQTVALKFCQNANKIEFHENMGPWLMCVLTNARYDQLRAKQRFMQPLSLTDATVEYSALPPEITAFFTPGAEIHLQVERVLKTLTELEQSLLNLSFMGGLSLAELSALFGLSATSISKRRGCALAKFRENLQKDQVIYDFFSHNAI